MPEAVMPRKIARAGNSTESSQPIQADRPTAPSRMTNTGVKQQTAATTEPTTPVLRMVRSFIAGPLSERFCREAVVGARLGDGLDSGLGVIEGDGRRLLLVGDIEVGDAKIEGA